MCWSADASLKTYLFALVMALVTEINPMWFFLVLYSHMQLVEYFLWSNIDDREKNELWSKIGSALIMAQPLALMALMRNSDLKMKMMAVYVLFMGGWFLTQTKKWETTVGENGHLQWNWFPESPWFMPLWCVWWFAPIILDQNWLFLGPALIGFLPSLYYYWKYNTAGTMWCWISVFSWLMFLLVQK